MENRIYILDNANDIGTVSVIDPSTYALLATVRVGNQPEGISVNPAGTRVYVANYDAAAAIDRGSGGTLSVIDTATNKVIVTVSVGRFPHGAAVHPDGTRVYVTQSSSGQTVSVIDTATNRVIDSIPVGFGPSGIAVHPDGKWVYVASSLENTISVIDSATNTVMATVPVGFGPSGIAVHPDGSRVYVANSNDGTISVIDTATNKAIDTVQVGGCPIAFGLVG